MVVSAQSSGPIEGEDRKERLLFELRAVLVDICSIYTDEFGFSLYLGAPGDGESPPVAYHIGVTLFEGGGMAVHGDPTDIETPSR